MQSDPLPRLRPPQPHPEPRRALAVLALTASVLVVASCQSTRHDPAAHGRLTAESPGKPPTGDGAVVPPTPGTVAVAPSAEPYPDDAGACASDQVHELVDALAIPHAQSGDIELVLTNHDATCNYAADRAFSDRCDVWRARVMLPPEAQEPGAYSIDQSFAYLDQRVSGAPGRWTPGRACRMAGGNLSGTLVIESVERNRITGYICGSATGDSNPSIIDGRFVAMRCPSCAGTGDACVSASDCCNNACSAGRCIP